MTRLQAAQAAYLYAKADHEATMRISHEAKAAVLMRGHYISEYDGSHILSPADDYAMSDEQFAAYLQQVHAERIARGLDIPSAELTAGHKTLSALIAAEHELLAALMQIIPADLSAAIARGCRIVRVRRAVLDLAVRLDPATVPEALRGVLA